MLIPTEGRPGGLFAALKMAVTIAVVVAVVGLAVLMLLAGQSFEHALSAVIPGAALGAAASMVFVLLGTRRGRLQASLDRMDEEERLRRQREGEPDELR
ncbi:MAG TPA: hypothetical protein VGT61_01685 [Thermomicrobiales bacterium]|jgi:hypothetical protein|nr:hypothetical protein [Thermomicrobiales bacterium]